MTVLGIDPGPTESAFVAIESDPFEIRQLFLGPNLEVRALLRDHAHGFMQWDAVSIEFLQSYGMPVGADTFETCFWCGRFAEVLHGAPVYLHSRTKIRSTITGVGVRCKDSDVNRALRVRFGDARKGEPLEGVKKHLWAALAAAVYHADGAVMGDWASERVCFAPTPRGNDEREDGRSIR